MFLYRLLLILSLPILGIRMAFALIKKTETTKGILQRFGGTQGPKSKAPVIWVHGASLGELTAAKVLIDDLLVAKPDINVLVSANTTSGRNLVNSWDNSRIISTLAPLDNPLIVRRFMGFWQPIAIVSLENELWPTRFDLAAQRGIPVVVIAGRLSAKSAAMWARFPKLARRVMGSIDALFPLDATNGQRFLGLGLGEENLRDAANLKSGVVLAQPNAAELVHFSAVFPRPLTILAASTHAGEEALILRAFADAHSAHANLRLILAPRHAARSSEVSELIKTTGLPFKTRSAGQAPDGDTTIYLADTTGEMALWYSLASVVLLGGSWVPKGGHSPVEPVQFGATVVHGPDISNHAQAFEALKDVGASIELNRADDLVQYLTNHARQPATTNTGAAKLALENLRNKTATTAAIIDTISELTRQK